MTRKDRGGGETFLRTDPRRFPAYASLAQSVRKQRSYFLHDPACSWVRTGPYAPLPTRTPEAQRLRALLDFSCRCVRRLQIWHDLQIRKHLCGEAFWSALGAGGVCDETAAAVTGQFENLYEEQPRAHNVICDLASLNVANNELFSDCTIYHFKDDRIDAAGNVGVSTSGGSSFWADVSSYLAAIFGAYNEERDPKGAPLYGVVVGSDEHFAYLLGVNAKYDPRYSPLQRAFGEEVCTRLFDVLAYHRKKWPQYVKYMRTVDAGGAPPDCSGLSDSESEDEEVAAIYEEWDAYLEEKMGGVPGTPSGWYTVYEPSAEPVEGTDFLRMGYDACQ